jgi:tRNA (cytidine/uridine-2'-O-)-methyltransferase
LEIIEPCGFVLSDKALKRAALDYAAEADIAVHPGWEAFQAAPARKDGRLILFTTKGASSLAEFEFHTGDTLLFGRETVGAPEEVHAAADARLRIPITGRSLNLSVSVAIALFEALRQTRLSAKAVRA